MSRPLVVDTFMANDELDILECRLYELYDAVDWFVIVEADVTHQDRPKPYHITDNIDRFAPYKDKLIVVHATGLPTLDDDPDPWAREMGQREHVATGLAQIGVTDDDIILHGDIDEIPRPLVARNIRTEGLLSIGMRGHFWAIDWLYPNLWLGTVAGKWKTIRRLGVTPFGNVRNSRNVAPNPPHLADAGWHLSWLGGTDRALRKVNEFCHPEVEDRIRVGLDNDRFYRDGIHVDGSRMAPVDVDETWPRWVVDGHAPANWYRPR
jgi:hypothetical protein